MARKIFGIARWLFDADTSKLKQGADEAKEAVKEVGDEAERTESRGSQAFGKLGENIEGRTEGLRKFAGALGAVVGIAAGVAGALTAVVSAVKAINDYTKDGAKLFNEWAKGLDTVGDTEGALKQVQDRIAEVSMELEAKEAGGLGSLMGRQREQIAEELDELRQLNIRLSRQVRAQRNKDNKDTVEEAKETAKQVADAFIEQQIRAEEDAEIQFLPEEEQIKERARLMRDRFREAAIEAGVDLNESVVQARLAQIDREEERKLEALQERIRLENEAAEERIRMETEAKIKAAQEAAEAFAKQLSTSTDNLTMQLGTIIKGIRDINRTSGRR